MAYEAVEPFPAQRTELYLAQLAMLIANANRDRTKQPTPYPLSDFLLFREERELTEGEIAAKNAATLEAMT